MNRHEVHDGGETVLLKSQLSVSIESDAPESGTERNGVSDGSHLG